MSPLFLLYAKLIKFIYARRFRRSNLFVFLVKLGCSSLLLFDVISFIPTCRGN